MGKKVVVFIPVHPAASSIFGWVNRNFENQFGGHIKVTNDINTIEDFDNKELLLIDLSPALAKNEPGRMAVSKKTAKRIAGVKNLKKINSQEKLLSNINDFTENFLNS